MSKGEILPGDLSPGNYGSGEERILAEVFQALDDHLQEMPNERERRRVRGLARRIWERAYQLANCHWIDLGIDAALSNLLDLELLRVTVVDGRLVPHDEDGG